MSQELEGEAMRRWRLVLGGGEADGTEQALTPADEAMDQALEALYDGDRTGGLAASSPKLVRWLDELRRIFPADAVRVLQKDAVERLSLSRLLLEPELLDAVEPDVQLVATLLGLRGALPERSREGIRRVIARVVEDLERQLARITLESVRGSLDYGARRLRPRAQDIDWPRTILRNMRHYVPERKALIPVRIEGMARRRPAMNDLILLVDQSGSMASSMIYAGVFASVLASIRALRTSLVVFDTEVADLTGKLSDPVELLLGIHLGGGTDIARALAYAEGIISRPERTFIVLISDLFEGPEPRLMLQRVRKMRQDGVSMVCLLALSDRGSPAYSGENAAALSAMGVPCFSCTPELFPAMMGAALRGEDVALWAARHGVPTARPR